MTWAGVWSPSCTRDHPTTSTKGAVMSITGPKTSARITTKPAAPRNHDALPVVRHLAVGDVAVLETGQCGKRETGGATP